MIEATLREPGYSGIRAVTIRSFDPDSKELATLSVCRHFDTPAGRGGVEPATRETPGGGDNRMGTDTDNEGTIEPEDKRCDWCGRPGTEENSLNRCVCWLEGCPKWLHDHCNSAVCRNCEEKYDRLDDSETELLGMTHTDLPNPSAGFRGDTDKSIEDALLYPWLCGRRRNVFAGVGVVAADPLRPLVAQVSSVTCHNLRMTFSGLVSVKWGKPG